MCLYIMKVIKESKEYEHHILWFEEVVHPIAYLLGVIPLPLSSHTWCIQGKLAPVIPSQNSH